MRTVTNLNELIRGKKPVQYMFRWLPKDYRLATCEFSEDGSFKNINYLKYLTLWLDRLNGGDKEYMILRKKPETTIFYTIVELQEVK